MPTWLTATSPDHGLAEPEEMHLSQGEQFSDDALTTTVQLKCPWASRHAIANNMLLGPSEWPYATGNGIYAATCGIKPFPGEAGTRTGAANQFYSHEFALLTVNFETLSVTGGSEPGTVNIYSESIEPSAEFITIPHSDFRWGSSSGTPIKSEEAPGKLQIGLDYVVSFFNVTSIPSWVTSLIGRCNTASVYSSSLDLTFAAQTLLFNPPKITRTISLGGSNYYQLVTRYTYRPDGWNKFWNAAATPPAFQSMYHKDSGDVAYLNFPTASFVGAVP